MKSPAMSRRGFLRSTAVIAAGSLLAACQPKAVIQEVTRVVKETVMVEGKAVEVTRIVKETVEVGKEVEVTKVVEKVVTPTPETGCQMDWYPTLPTPPKKYDPPVEIEAIFTTKATFVGDDNYLSNEMTKQLRDNMGIIYKIHWQGDGEVRTRKMAADVAAGTLPDLWRTSGSALQDYIDMGILEDIKDIWEATASPLVIERMGYPTNRSIWRPVLQEGKLWGIGWNNGPAHHVEQVPYMRKDVREKLGLKLPETIDELTETLKAMVESGLVKHGIFACKNVISKWYHSLDPIFGAFGAMPQIWVEAGDGTLKYDTLSSGVKEGLAVLRGWYEDGIIDADFYTYGERGPTVDYQWGNDIVGCWFAPWWHLFYLVPQWEQKPEIEVERFPYPKGPKGNRGRLGIGLGGSATVFRKGLDPIKIEAAINEYSWHMDKHVNFEEYQLYGAGKDGQCFCEGLEWVWDENCELKRGPVEDSFRYLGFIGMDYPMICYPDYQLDYFRPLIEWMEADPSTLNKAQRWIISDPRNTLDASNYMFVCDTTDVIMEEKFRGITTERFREYMPELLTLENQMLIGIITGELDLDDFDEFVDQWRSQGGDIVTEEVNKWWEAEKRA